MSNIHPDNTSGNKISPTVVALKVYMLGTNKLIINKLTVVDDETGITLHALINREVKKGKWNELLFSDEHDIAKVVTGSNINLIDLLDMSLLSTH